MVINDSVAPSDIAGDVFSQEERALHSAFPSYSYRVCNSL